MTTKTRLMIQSMKIIFYNNKLLACNIDSKKARERDMHHEDGDSAMRGFNGMSSVSSKMPSAVGSANTKEKELLALQKKILFVYGINAKLYWMLTRMKIHLTMWGSSHR